MTVSPPKSGPQPSTLFGKFVTGGTPKLRSVILLVGVLTAPWFVPRARGDWTFAIMGDTRGPHHTTTGVSPDLITIATKIAQLHPDFVLHCGDLCNGDDTNGLTALTYAQQFVNWKAAMSPVIASNIPIYTVRGNHENNCGEGAPLPDLKQAYYDAMGSAMPTNGPNNGTADDQRGFTYSFVHSNATFIVVDQYFYPVSPTGEYHSVDQTWVNQQLQQATTPHVVVMAHEPVFNEHFYGSSATGLVNRATFWNDLGANGSRLYICGHVHNLSVCLAPDDVGTGIYQLLAGNGGAPLDAAATNYDAGVSVLFTNDSNYGFALAKVGTNAMTIEYYLLNNTSNTWVKAGYTTTVLAGGGMGSAHGDWRILDHPDAVATFPRSVSGKKVVGIYYPTSIESHGFVYDGTTWTNLDYPGALYTEVLGIAGNKIVGSYYTDPAAQVWHGFVYDGKTWTTLDCPGAAATHAYGIQGSTIVGYYFDGRADQGFSYNGKTWTTLNKPQAGETFVNAISGKTMAGVYVGSDSLFHGYVYNGKNWTSLDVPGALETRCWGVSKTQAVGSYWIGPPGEHGYLYDLAGATWTTLDFPGAVATEPFGTDGQSVVGTFKAEDVTHGFIYGVAPDRAGRSAHAEGWVVGTTPADGYGVILHTTNGGHTWSRQGSASQIPNVPINNVKAVNHQTVWVVGNSANGYGLILRTDDGGKTWSRQGHAGLIPDVAVFGVGVSGKKIAWAVGSQGTILRTADGGQTWTQQPSGTTANLYEVAVINSKIAWIAGDTDNGYAVILHTTDGGQTWTRQGTAATLGAPAFIDLTAVSAQTAWAVGADGYVVETTDKGASWRKQMGPGLSHNNGVCGVNPQTAWIATDYNVIYRTIDGGTTWGRQAPQLLNEYYLLGVSALDKNTAWVVGGIMYPPDQGPILHTTDGGATWRIQSTPVNVTFRRASFVGSRK